MCACACACIYTTYIVLTHTVKARHGIAQPRRSEVTAIPRAEIAVPLPCGRLSACASALTDQSLGPHSGEAN